MPTYRNDGDITYKLTGTDGTQRTVPPGGTVETYDTSVPSDFTETLATPALVKTISGEDVWTDALCPKGPFNVSVSGEFSGAVSLQRSFDAFETPGRRVELYNNDTETKHEDLDPNAQYRLGIANGDWVSGVVLVQLSK